jgi:hypothetical protein
MQVVKKQTHIRVSMENKEGLEHKRHKLRLNSVNDVISVLLQKEEEFSILKNIERRKKSKVIVEEKPKIELPSLNGKCLFKANRKDGNIDCAKDFVEKDILHSLTTEQCDECWNNAMHVMIKP